MREQISDNNWLKYKITELKEEHLLELWKQYQTSEVAFLDLHFKYANWYSAFFIALFAAYLIGLLENIENRISLMFIAIPILIIIIAHLAKIAMDRFYRRFLEAVTMIVKIEQLMGFNSSIQTEAKRKNDADFWLKDKHFLPERYYTSRHSDETSEDFINNNLRKGANKIVCDTFLTFQIVAVILIITQLILFYFAYIQY